MGKKMDHAEFYRSLRKRNSGVFGTSMTQGQVNGCEAILAECERVGADLGQTAYILATAYGESAHKMQPVREGMYYRSAARIRQVFSASRRQGIPAEKLTRNPRLLANTVYGGAWGEKNLGNRPGTDDGWNFRGFWIGQITGRHNAKKWAAGLGVDLLGNPKLIDDPKLAVKGLVLPMLEGWATGHALPKYVKGNKRDYRSARQVWNGTFEASKYAGYAKAFETALTAAGWKVEPVKLEKPVSPPSGKAPNGVGIIGAVLAALAAMIFRKRK